MKTTYSLKIDRLDCATMPVATLVENEGLTLEELTEQLVASVANDPAPSDCSAAFDITIARHET